MNNVILFLISFLTKFGHANDGLIDVTSATSWPGATNLLMQGSNHSQMKNDNQLRLILRGIYDGTSQGGIWWKINPK